MLKMIAKIAKSIYNKTMRYVFPLTESEDNIYIQTANDSE